ncbi:MAG: hypothetical protein M1830_005029 [Pleopsidium flavum]|nr:MAG: hypothetical protein M1830_005029 [Pleopsidium flavum]
MSAPQPPTLPPTARSEEQYARFKHTMSLCGLVIAPILIALPPRKLDFYTFGLSTFWLLSLNHITAERSGRSILQHINTRKPSSLLVQDLPSDKARDLQERLKRERLLRAQPSGQGGESRGLVDKLWMGQEQEGWRERRIKEEQEALEEGRGYGGLIMDQIWEVWNWGKRKEDRRIEEHGPVTADAERDDWRKR